MKNLLILIMISSTFLHIYAKEKKVQFTNKELIYKYNSFDQAMDEKNYLKFKGTSTKFKVFTTEFEGVAKEFKITYSQNNNEIKDIIVSIVSLQLDTDNNSRNKKMFEKCLETEKYPNIVVTSNQTISLKDGASGELDVVLQIKDKKLSRKLNFSISEQESKGTFDISFTTDFSFIEAGIEDPSIAIAKVGEIFTISGNIEIK